jgi:hypothetical protein
LKKKDSFLVPLIILLSIIIPIVVALLMLLPDVFHIESDNFDFSSLPFLILISTNPASSNTAVDPFNIALKNGNELKSKLSDSI